MAYSLAACWSLATLAASTLATPRRRAPQCAQIELTLIPRREAHAHEFRSRYRPFSLLRTHMSSTAPTALGSSDHGSDAAAYSARQSNSADALRRRATHPTSLLVLACRSKRPAQHPITRPWPNSRSSILQTSHPLQMGGDLATSVSTSAPQWHPPSTLLPCYSARPASVGSTLAHANRCASTDSS